jgi:hypothetical protein
VDSSRDFFGQSSSRPLDIRIHKADHIEARAQFPRRCELSRRDSTWRAAYRSSLVVCTRISHSSEPTGRDSRDTMVPRRCLLMISPELETGLTRLTKVHIPGTDDKDVEGLNGHVCCV